LVDDFGVKYVGKEHADHLLHSLKQQYEVTEDWEGKLYCGISLKWEYDNRKVDLSMPANIENALHKFQHKPPDRPQHVPYPAQKPQYGSKVQLTPEFVDSPTLAPEGKKWIQQVVGALMYYARAVDPTLMAAISSLASQQATSTEDTATKLLQLLNYCATHPNATLRCHARDIILNIHSNARYLNETESRNRAGGHFFMNSKPRNGEQHHNYAVLTLLTILRMVASSAAEA
jgi:hypothetical protein